MWGTYFVLPLGQIAFVGGGVGGWWRLLLLRFGEAAGIARVARRAHSALLAVPPTFGNLAQTHAIYMVPVPTRIPTLQSLPSFMLSLGLKPKGHTHVLATTVLIHSSEKHLALCAYKQSPHVRKTHVKVPCLVRCQKSKSRVRC